MTLFPHDPAFIASRPAAWPPPRDAATVERAIDWAARRDPIGHPLQIALGMLHLASLPLATSVGDITFLMLIVCAAVRLWATRWCYPPVLRAPVTWLITGAAAWWTASLLWTPDTMQGWDELRTLRMFLLPLALWPVIGRANLLIAAAMVGVAAQNVLQGAQFMSWASLAPDVDGRLGGLLHPIPTGAWCAASMLWCLGPMLRGRAVIATAALIMFTAAGIGLIATGSRGPWIAAALTLPTAILWIMARRPQSRRRGIVLCFVGGLGLAALLIVGGDRVESRLTDATREYRAAVDHETYDTSVGLRVGQARWSWTLITESPWIGHGAGSFRHAVNELPDFQATVAAQPRLTEHFTRDHPHSSWLQVAVTTGAIGLALFVLMLLVALGQTFRDASRARRVPSVDHLFVDGTPFVVISWIIGAFFDCPHLNGHLLGLLALALAVTSPNRPRILPRLTSREPAS